MPGYCVKCGAPLGQGTAFCTSCGAAVEAPVSPMRPASPALAVPSPTPVTPIASGTRSSKTPLLIAGGIVVAVIIVIVGILLGTSSQSPSPSQSATPSPTSPVSQDSTATTSNVAQVVRRLGDLLATSALQRQGVSGATADIADCTNLEQAQSRLSNSAGQRQALLNQLSNVPVSSLPGGAQMLSDLTNGWQASIESDNSYAQWAADEISQGCTPNDTGDSNYQAAQGTDQEATSDKGNFTTAWDALAPQYGLPSYSASDI